MIWSIPSYTGQVSFDSRQSTNMTTQDMVNMIHIPVWMTAPMLETRKKKKKQASRHIENPHFLTNQQLHDFFNPVRKLKKIRGHQRSARYKTNDIMFFFIYDFFVLAEHCPGQVPTHITVQHADTLCSNSQPKLAMLSEPQTLYSCTCITFLNFKHLEYTQNLSILPPLLAKET